MESASPPLFWGFLNRLLYRLYWLVRGVAPRRASRRFYERARRRLPATATDQRPLLYIAWGRIGDAVLGTAVTRHLRRLFGRPVVMVGREEVQALVSGHVDRFVPFCPASWQRDAGYRSQFFGNVWDEYDLVIADIHLFNGGAGYFNELIDLLPARDKFVYEGYAGPKGLAPSRSWPRTATVIASLEKPSLENPTTEDLGARHVWNDLVHYTRSILAACDRRTDLDPGDARPVVELGVPLNQPALLEQHGLEAGTFIACQPISNNVKKDYPLDRWRQVFAAFGDQQFVLLGSAREAGKAAQLDLPNVRSLCGRTSLVESMQILRQARAFVGVDSGLTHIATCSSVPTVAVIQSSNLGWFFPYPAALDADNLQAVHAPDFVSCSGCFMACTREPIWNTYRKGSLCLRTLDPESVVEAVAAALPAASSSRSAVSAAR